MATLYGVNYTKYLTGPTEANIQARGMVSGNLSFIRDTYEASGTTAGDVVYLGHKLNAGDRVLGFIMSTDDLGTGVTIDIGDTHDDNRYADGIDVATAAVSGSVAILVDGMDYVVGTNSGDDILTIKLQDAAATGTVKILILYSRC